MHSCLYVGSVTHHRRAPVSHAFRYPVTMAYLDLAETPRLLASLRLLSSRRYALAAYRAEDHSQQAVPLDKEIRMLVEQQTGLRPSGPIRLLTQLRCLGFYFSPLNLYFCFDASGNSATGNRIAAVVAEVTNTPWRETHRYVLTSNTPPDASGELRTRHAKEFHVSPFMPLDQQYAWSITPPAENLRVTLDTNENSARLFRAELRLEQRPLTDFELARMMGRQPIAAFTILRAIYWQAFCLWWKQCPFYPHPKHQAAPLQQPSLQQRPR